MDVEKLDSLLAVHERARKVFRETLQDIYFLVVRKFEGSKVQKFESLI